MDIPRRFNWVAAYRSKLHRLTRWLPLPRVNPSLVSALSLLFSVGFAFTFDNQRWLAAALLLLALIFDWLDGAIAERYGLASRKGWIIDSISDRLGEAVVLTPFNIIWTYLFALNTILTFVSYKIKINLTMPLRFAFLLYFLIFIIPS